jgi:hypothetical protein
MPPLIGSDGDLRGHLQHGIAWYMPNGQWVSLALGSDGRESGGKEVTSEDFFIEAVDVNDRDAVFSWIEDLCSDAEIGDMAAALKVEPTLASVVTEITSFLPPSIRAEAADLCKAQLQAGDSSP